MKPSILLTKEMLIEVLLAENTDPAHPVWKLLSPEELSGVSVKEDIEKNNIIPLIRYLPITKEDGTKDTCTWLFWVQLRSITLDNETLQDVLIRYVPEKSDSIIQEVQTLSTEQKLTILSSISDSIPGSMTYIDDKFIYKHSFMVPRYTGDSKDDAAVVAYMQSMSAYIRDVFTQYVHYGAAMAYYLLQQFIRQVGKQETKIALISLKDIEDSYMENKSLAVKPYMEVWAETIRQAAMVNDTVILDIANWSTSGASLQLHVDVLKKLQKDCPGILMFYDSTVVLPDDLDNLDKRALHLELFKALSKFNDALPGEVTRTQMKEYQSAVRQLAETALVNGAQTDTSETQQTE